MLRMLAQVHNQVLGGIGASLRASKENSQKFVNDYLIVFTKDNVAQ